MASDAIASRPGRRRLIVNADDFGRSDSINQAVIRAHREGILTTASLMVTEAACPEAVALAKENPALGVGLHLTLVCGRSALPAARIPGLVDSRNEFSANASAVGFRYFFNRRLRDQLRDEIGAQFARFHATGLALDHVNGHLHLHLHPVVFQLLAEQASQLGIRQVRITYDPLWLNLQLASGNLGYRLSHALVFHSLAFRARQIAKRRGFKYTARVFGLLQNARVDRDYVQRLLPRLPPGDSELYSHPSLDDSKDEFDALVSPQARQQVDQFGIQLIRYQDL